MAATRTNTPRRQSEARAITAGRDRAQHNGGSGGDGEEDGGRGEKEGEDGTTSYGGDVGGENGGTEGGSRRHCADGAGDGKAARKAPHPAGGVDEEDMVQLQAQAPRARYRGGTN